ncbi:1-acylglycerol-3-phosphate O-acyltransferase [Linnemannia zychae]|nr:1-acylglycerol-3-phosphate O-acyltransferase [Linnemannia zychae]
MSLESSVPWGAIVFPIFLLALPRILAILPQKIQFFAKCGVVLIATFIMSIAGCLISIIFALLNRRYEINYVVARIFSYIAAKPCSVTFTVSGEENLEKYPAIVVCNHQSSMDMMILGRVFPKHCVVMAKKELKFFPFLGIFMTLSNAIFIDRKNHKKAIESTTQAVADMKKHNSGIWIFPEGTRSHLETADLLPFKKGAFHLAIQSQVPILPIVAAGYSHIYDSSSRSFPGGKLEIRVLEPIPTIGLTVDDVNVLMERTRNIMLKNLKEMDQSTILSNSSSMGSSTAITGEINNEGLKQRRTAKE